MKYFDRLKYTAIAFSAPLPLWLYIVNLFHRNRRYLACKVRFVFTMNIPGTIFRQLRCNVSIFSSYTFLLLLETLKMKRLIWLNSAVKYLNAKKQMHAFYLSQFEVHFFISKSLRHIIVCLRYVGSTWSIWN